MDGRSAVESFYGAPGNRQSTSYAPVEHNPEDDPFTPPPRGRRDSASTFFGRNDEKGEYEMQSRPSGGRASLYGQPRQEPVKYDEDPEDGATAFDIYADFNNAGPRYSGAQNLNAVGKAGADGYVPSSRLIAHLGLHDNHPFSAIILSRRPKGQNPPSTTSQWNW